MQVEIKTITSASGMPVTFYFGEGSTVALPSVILLHERYGLVQHTGDLARSLAREGFCVSTPDLFFYVANQEGLHMGIEKATPSDPYVMGLLDEVVDLLRAESRANCDRLAMIGVCQTGRYPIIYGAKRPLDACVVLYGGVSNWKRSEHNPEPMEDLIRHLDAPLLGLYGEKDHSIPISSVIRLRNELEANDKSYKIKIFEDMPHGWLNSTMPGRYRKVAADNATFEIARFMKQHLSETSLRPGRVVFEFESNKSSTYDFGSNVRFE